MVQEFLILTVRQRGGEILCSGKRPDRSWWTFRCSSFPEGLEAPLRVQACEKARGYAEILQVIENLNKSSKRERMKMRAG